MSTEAKLTAAFPGMKSEEGGWFAGRPGYRELVDDFGHRVLVEVTDSDYEGDSRFVLLAADGRVGYLRFGWGSCSGCDALEACASVADVARLYDGLKDCIVWHATAAAALKWFRERDWKATESWYREHEEERFQAEAVAALERLSS